MGSVTIQELKEDQKHHLGLSLMAGSKGLQKRITHAQVQKMGLALAGFLQFVNPERLQVMGKTEMVYLGALAPEAQERIIRELCSLKIACLVVTRNLEIPSLLLEEAERRDIPLLRSSLHTTDFIERVTEFLEERLAATTSIHGVLIDVFGVGILLLGKSGIGKSECALDLIRRGHRLVADDMVHIQKRGSSLHGRGFELIKHHMEIRGLGIINVRNLFGVEAIRETKKVEMVLELTDWATSGEYDRLGFEEEKYSILDIELPMLRVPVTPGRNLATIIEVAARNYLLKTMGHDSAAELENRLLCRIEKEKHELLDPKEEVE